MPKWSTVDQAAVFPLANLLGHLREWNNFDDGDVDNQSVSGVQPK
jgi:hypothetical protein